jgi:intracellular septation protein
VLYWLFGSVLLGGALAGRNFIRVLLKEQIALPDVAWNKLNWSWIVFFLLMGAANLYVAFSFSTDVWVNFKLFGSMGLMLVFVLAQGLLLAKYVEESKQ